MFSVLTNIYNKKTKGPTLMQLFTATGKLIFFYNKRCSMCAMSPVVHTSNVCSCQKKKKNFFSFPVAVNDCINVGPLVFFL